MLACQYNEPKRPGDLDLWPFDLENGVWVTCEVGYLCANFNFPMPLCCRVRPDVRDRQTDRRQTKASLNAPPIRGVGIINKHCVCPYGKHAAAWSPTLQSQQCVEVWAVRRPQIEWNKVWCLPTQQCSSVTVSIHEHNMQMNCSDKCFNTFKWSQVDVIWQRLNE